MIIAKYVLININFVSICLCLIINIFLKFVILQCDRFVEFHSQEGRYYRLRIPKFGHDMKYHFPTCDLYIGGNR